MWRRRQGFFGMPLTYLLQLEHARLPLHVIGAPDVRRVSILKATGLVEATIEPALATGGSYRQAQAALVTCITDDGHAEIAKLRGRSAPNDESLLKAIRKSLAPLAYLRKIEHASFPLRVEVRDELHCVEALKQAGFIDAAIRPPSASETDSDTSESPELATIRRITPLGRAELARGR